MMSLKQTYGVRFDSSREYLTRTEYTLFEQMRDSGEITMFRLAVCKECGADIPRTKKYCSKKCMEANHDTGEMD